MSSFWQEVRQVEDVWTIFQAVHENASTELGAQQDSVTPIDTT